MKKLVMAFYLLLLTDLIFAADYPPYYYIPSSGQTINNLTQSQVSGQTFFVGTNGSVNLGSNTYTLTYASFPYGTTSWNVIFDASQLTLNNGSQVNLFGETPLVTYPNTKKFYIQFNVIWSSTGSPVKNVNYFSNIIELTNFSSPATFDSTVTFNDTVVINRAIKFGTTPSTDLSATALGVNGSGTLVKSCTAWCTTGNSGLNSSTNFIGTTDAVDLVFKVNNILSGKINITSNNTSYGYGSFRSNTFGTDNVAIGFNSLRYNTTGTYNTGVGSQALYTNTTGIGNTAIGLNSLTLNTTGISNVGVGYSSLPNETTGTGNIAVGTSTGLTLTTGSYNTIIGYTANVATSSTTGAIALGRNAVASSNQLAISNVRAISIPNMTSAVGYVLTDTSGNGDFVPRATTLNQQTYYTPVTGDSVIVTTTSNLINPAGTIANFTVRLPASPYSGQILEFSTTQTITTLHWSTALSSDATSVEIHVPTTLSAGGVIKIIYNTSTTKWYNW